MRSDRGPAATTAAAAGRRARARWRAGCGAAVVAVGLAGWSLPGQAAGPRVGRPAPPLTLHTLDGRSISTAELRGQVVILTFWATWCAPCRQELPLLSAYATAHAGQGLQVLAFSLDDADSLPAVRQVAAGLSFPAGLLGGAYAGDYGRIWRLPVNFTIDRAGTLVGNSWQSPRPEWTTQELERVVTPLLERPR